MSCPKRRTNEAWLAKLEARLPRPAAEPLPPEVAPAFLDAALAVHDRTGSAKLAKRAGLHGATAVAAELASGLPPRPQFAIGDNSPEGETTPCQPSPSRNGPGGQNPHH
jgi:hypothetical protein